MVDVSSGEFYFYLNDNLGTPQMLTDAAGMVVWEGIYRPFGETDVNPNSTVENNFRFAGQYYNAETGYHYNYHRYYDPKTGRYLSPDPIGLAGGINLYVYAGLNPITAIDPLGLDFFSEYNENLRRTTRFFFKGTTSLTRTGLGLVTSGSFAKTMGTVTPIQAARSLFQTPAGIATLGGIGGTFLAAGAHVVGNTAAGAASIFGGVGFGSIINAIPTFNDGMNVGGWWVDFVWDIMHGAEKEIECQ